MSISCPLCGCNIVRHKGKIKQEEILLCNTCGLAFFDLKEEYTYRHQDWYNWLEINKDSGDTYLKLFRRYYLKQLKILSSLVGGRHLLDIGAGVGLFAKVAKDAGWNCACNEINAKAREFGTRIYKMEYKALEDIPFESQDIVRLSHVLEHVSDPAAFLSRVKNIMKSDGVCVVMVPNFEPLNCIVKNLILSFIPGEHNFRGQIYPPTHILGFTPRSLKNMLVSFGLRPIRVYCVSYGNRVYYPWNWKFTFASLKEVAFGLVDMLGNAFGRGSWVIGYFRK